MKTLLRSFQFAILAHHGQVRKYSGVPYITHPTAVAQILNDFGATEHQKVVGVLHDVIEDTDYTFQDVADHFGYDIANDVDALTNKARDKSEPRAVRRSKDVEQMRHASPLVKSVRLADMFHNLGDIAKADPVFAKIYMAEKRVMLKVLIDADIPGLYSAVFNLVETYLEKHT